MKFFRMVQNCISSSLARFWISSRVTPDTSRIREEFGWHYIYVSTWIYTYCILMEIFYKKYLIKVFSAKEISRDKFEYVPNLIWGFRLNLLSRLWALSSSLATKYISTLKSMLFSFLHRGSCWIHLLTFKCNHNKKSGTGFIFLHWIIE